MATTIRVEYSRIVSQTASIDVDPMPYLPVIFHTFSNQKISASGLVDSGAEISALPRSVGEQIGLTWSGPHPEMEMGGTLGGKAKMVRVKMQVHDWQPESMGFAWFESDNAPLIFGQVNFFEKYRVCFYRAELAFDIRPQKAKRTS